MSTPTRPTLTTQARLRATARRQCADLMKTLALLMECAEMAVESPDRYPRIALIKRHVCAAHNLPASAMVSRSRQRAYNDPRQLCMFLCRELTGHSLQEIGAQFRRDHGTVICAWKATAARMDPKTRGGPAYAAHVAVVRERCAAALAGHDLPLFSLRPNIRS